MWIMIVSMVIPLLLKLFEYLRDKQAAGELLTERETRIVNKLNHVTGKVRSASVQLGCLADGLDERMASIVKPDDWAEIKPLTMEQFLELKRLLKLGDAATQEEWDAFEKWVNQ